MVNEKQTKLDFKEINSLSSENYMKLVENATEEELAIIIETLDHKVSSPLIEKGLLKPLFTVHEGPRSFASIIAWWESRRLIFNIIVGACGFPTFIILLFGHFGVEFTIIGSILYAVMANLAYTLGWMAEIITRSCLKEKAKDVGPILLSLGIIFSVFVTLGFGALMILSVII